MIMLTTRRTLGAKVEAAYGTAETITGAEVMYVYDPKFSPNLEAWVRNPHKPSLSPLAPTPGRSRGSVSFKVEFMGSSGAGTAPFYGPLLQACGRAETITASTKVDYDFATTSLKSVTLKLFVDGISVQLRGARGTVSMEAQAGQVPKLNFTFEGLWDPRVDAGSWKDEALLAGSAYPSFDPKPFYAASLTIDAYKAITEAVNWADNNRLTPVPDGNTAGVYKRIDLVGRDPSGEADAEAVTVATKDFMTLFANQTPFVLEFFVGADDGGNGTGSLNTMTDSTKNWPTSKWASGYSIRDSAGTVFAITASDGTTVTVSGTPASGEYQIYQAGKLIQVRKPKCVMSDLTDQDANGLYRLGLPFKYYQASGDDEQKITVR